MIDREDSPGLFTDSTVRDMEVQPDKATPAGDVSTGERLRAAREAKGLSLADCASELHLPVKVLERLERNEFGQAEHFVFLRGALSGYAKFLGMPPGSCDQTLRAIAPAEQPALVSVTRTSPARWLLQRYGTAATYIVLTATIAVPLVLLGLRGGLERPATRIVSLDQAPAASAQPPQPAATSASAGHAAPSPDATPFRASMTPFAAIGLSDITGSDTTKTPVAPAPVPPVVAGGQHALTIAASSDCWFEITDASGGKVDSGLLRAGDTRTWHSAGVLHVTLGNARGVSVIRDGQPLALAPYLRANVARFDVFGKPAGSAENGRF
ncbi:MAG TPA: RodZ domain-containing protein [Rhodanobacteraceae bacterium]|nr:RodZ domain-containing protein [Rhodanobacteraceae bacterium]